jgi:NTP pyrophosphatase (non-canonical NTP hydrolase)
MTFDDFQQAALRTSRSEPHRERLLVQALGLAGEAAEVGQLVKKWAWHGRPLEVEAIKDELSDVLWYLSDLASAVGLSLDEIAQHNTRKLWERYPSGFPTGRTETKNRFVPSWKQRATR